MKPANTRTAALAHIASATMGPAARSRPLRFGLAACGTGSCRGAASGAAWPAA